ncbi:hypothetical protein BCR44DRAFT_34384 [Catenaria anguillulae PL171]|uniref:Apple domain-containing protein n=1 Tax=Catenaria anguillulae PL171 TaxID=765915 RepID=A0A1Y2HMH2_9FUNG|nr:hypothetical protein BCR44DRAFT_34384 [Catenaria anguillulae PL171]
MQSPILLDRTNRIGAARTFYKEPFTVRSWDFGAPAAAADPAQYPSRCIKQCATQVGGPPSAGCNLPQVSTVIEKNIKSDKLEVAMQCLMVNGGMLGQNLSHQFKFGSVRNGTLPWIGGSVTSKNGSIAAKECFGECNSLPNCWAASYFGFNQTCVQLSTNQTTGGSLWVWELDMSVPIPTTMTFGDLGSELKMSVSQVSAQLSAGGASVHEGLATLQLAAILALVFIGAML